MLRLRVNWVGGAVLWLSSQGLEWMTPSSMLSEKRKSEVLAAVERVHKQDYLDEVRTICAKGGGSADQDT